VARAARSGMAGLVRSAAVEGADCLCDVLVFVEESSGAVASLDAEALEVDHVVRQRSERRGLAKSAVRPMLVVEGLVIVEQPTQVWNVPDQCAVGQLRAQRAEQAFRGCADSPTSCFPWPCAARGIGSGEE